MRYKNDKKISNLSSPDSFFQAQNAAKFVFGRWESLRRSPSPRPPSQLGSPLNAFGVSNSAPTEPWFSDPPQHKIHGYVSGTHVLSNSHISTYVVGHAASRSVISRTRIVESSLVRSLQRSTDLECMK